MVDVTDLAESKLKAYFQTLGLLDELLVDGETLPALTVQLGQYRPAKLSKSERALSIVITGENNTGESGKYADKNVTLIISGQGDRDDSLNAKLIAHHFNETIAASKGGDDACIMGLITQGVSSFEYEDSGRVSYEIQMRVMIGRSS
jgi:hypothetical protein